ncbi:hypothetical protein FSARC_13206, partial [Fusarium sarcochroum]
MPRSKHDGPPVNDQWPTDPYAIRKAVFAHDKLYKKTLVRKRIKDVLARYDTIRLDPHIHQDCRRELYVFLKDPSWLTNDQSASQYKFYKHLTGNGRAQIHAHFGKWLVWNEDFPGTAAFYPTKTPDGAQQLIKFKGEVGDEFTNKWRKQSPNKKKSKRKSDEGDDEASSAAELSSEEEEIHPHNKREPAGRVQPQNSASVQAQRAITAPAK